MSVVLAKSTPLDFCASSILFEDMVLRSGEKVYSSDFDAEPLSQGMMRAACVFGVPDYRLEE